MFILTYLIIKIFYFKLMYKLAKVLFSWEQWYQENSISSTLIQIVAIKIILCYAKAAESENP